MGTWAFSLALAASTVIAPAGASSIDQYTPSIPPGYTLAGSTVVTECVTGEPQITYSLRLASSDDPGIDALDPGTPGGDAVEASLVVTGPRASATIDLGTFTEAQPTRTIAWPSSLDALADDLRPGEGLSATLVVSPEVAPALRVPISAHPCTPSGAAALATTGASYGGVMWLGAGAAVVVAGGVLLVLRRRQHR